MNGWTLEALRAADTAVTEALADLRRASAVGWRSPAGDTFRTKLSVLVADVTRLAAAVDEARADLVRAGANA